MDRATAIALLGQADCGATAGWYRAPYLSLGASTVWTRSRHGWIPNELDATTPIPGGYTLVNLGAGVQIPTGRQLLSLDVDLINAFNQQYVWFLNRYRNFVEDNRNLGMGRNLIMRASWTF